MLRILQWILRIGLGIAVLWMVIVVAILLRLNQSPLDLKPYHDWIESALKLVVPDFDIHFKEAYLSWEGIHRPITIDLKKTELHVGSYQIQVKGTHAEIRLRSLLLGQVLPTGLVIKQPTIQLNLQDIDKHASSTSSSSFINTVEKVWGSEENTKILKHLTVTDATFILNNTKNLPYIELNNVGFVLERTKENVTILTSGKGSDTLAWSAKWQYNRDAHTWTSKGAFHHLPLQKIIHTLHLNESILNIPNSTYLDINFNALGNLSSKISWQAHTTLSMSPGLITLKYADGKPLPLVVKKALATFYMSDEKTVCNNLDLDFDKGHVSLCAYVNTPFEKLINLTTAHPVIGALTVTDISADTVKAYWPAHIAQDIHAYINKYLVSGTIHEANLGIKADIGGQQSFNVKDTAGNVTIQDATIQYLEGLPPVQSVWATGTYRDNTLIFNVTKGLTCNQTIQKALISLLLSKNPVIKIDAHSFGPLAKVLDLLSNPALNLLKPTDLPFKIMDGTHTTHLILDIPLSKEIGKDHVHYAVTCHLNDMHLVYPFQNKNIPLTKGVGDLTVDKQNITYKGSIDFENKPITIAYTQPLNSNVHTKTHIDIQTVLNAVVLKPYLPIFIGEHMAGSIPLDVKLEKDQNNVMGVNVKASLSNIKLQLGQWTKAKGSPLDLTLQGVLNQGHLQTLDVFKLKGKAVDIDGKATWNTAGNLESIVITKGILDKTNVVGSLQYTTLYKVMLKGKYIDLSPFIDMSVGNDDKPSTLSVDATIHVKEVNLKSDQSFYNTNVHLKMDKGFIKHLLIEGYADQANQQSILVKIHSPLDKVQSIAVRIPQFGLFLKKMDIIKTIEGGDLIISGLNDQKESKQALWKATLLINDFKLKKAPFIGRLLGLAFPTGFSDFVQGNKLSFKKLKLALQANDTILSIGAGRAYGPSLGFSVYGQVHRKEKTLNLAGSIMPAYGLNTFFSKIPVIGRALMGGKNEGLFGVSYRVYGPLSKPKISVNPLSILTPGFLRRLFTGNNPNDLFDEPDVTEE